MTEHKVIQPYKHECGRGHCSFVGWMPTDRGMANVYICRNSVARTVSLIVRYSDEPHDYMLMRIPEDKRSPWPLVDMVPEPKKVFTVVCVANDWESSNNSYVSFAEADNADAAAEEVLEGLRVEEDEAGVREPDDPDKWTVIAVFEGRHMDRFPQ